MSPTCTIKKMMQRLVLVGAS